MASVVDSAILTVSISESIELNGRKIGGQEIRKISGINEVLERIVTVQSSGTPILAFGSSPGAGTFVRDNVKYIRITNLDDSTAIRLVLINANTDVNLEVNPLQSFIISKITCRAENDAGSITPDNITSIKAYTDSSAGATSSDVEIFVASV